MDTWVACGISKFEWHGRWTTWEVLSCRQLLLFLMLKCLSRIAFASTLTALLIQDLWLNSAKKASIVVQLFHIQWKMWKMRFQPSSSFNAKQIASAVFFFVDELIPRMCFVFPHGKDWPEYVCTMNSLARLTCVGLVAAGAACDETCAAAAAVSGRILLQQKESIQPMKTVEEPTTLEEPTTTFLFLGFFPVRQNSAQQTTPPNHPFFSFCLPCFFCLRILFFWKTIWDHLLKKSLFHTPFCQMFSFSFADFFERRNWWPSKSCPVNIRKSAGWCVVI